MKKALAFGIAALLLVPAGASAHGGYLHRADAEAAAATYARAEFPSLGAASGTVVGCARHANRVIGCLIRYEGVPFSSALWALDEAVAVEFRHGVVAVHSRLF